MLIEYNTCKKYKNHKPIKHVDEMLKFMRIFAEDERFLQLDIKKDEKGEVTMCTILDNAINKGIERGITQGISMGEDATLKLVKILIAGNKINEIEKIYKIYNDKEYRNKLMKEYNIYK